ncbi:hypothetical protein J22TS1_12320 [Siminovitchia terrae]|uniref:aminotransferase class I/II-fold pyridoxal phosphate-dependent enzyme n=1 Tax=Siminovitchia terrae TaxID=1914933 RepID=UPI001B2B6539|nr:aminotransferase class I/II-fold pyridoxal phosphate-dependent enzyme [Siminovitchia terrae]GIN90181.1 hypothetical protein J22TS1_12320 [Siminovitchia terrae]
MNELAENLNACIQKSNPYIFELLSDLGKRLYYPKGILSQSAEASTRATRYNATIGIATVNNSPMHYKHIHETLKGYSPEEVYPYAPPAGKEELREEWKKKLLRENPSLKTKSIGLPIVTNALTHGLSILADLFVNENDTIILPDKYWGNYASIFHIRRGGSLITFDLFDQYKNVNVVGFREQLLKQKKSGKAIVLLNFPNNPTGYTPDEVEIGGIISALLEAAEAGINIVLILDDAYFGLFYENSIKESPFGRVAGLHSRILPIKVDGATKESYVWGLRVGFITYASHDKEVLEALEQKTKGIIRGTISSSSHLSQTIVLNSLKSNEYEEEKRLKYELMKKRAERVKEIVSQDKYQEVWTHYPFNSGYFMCLKIDKVNTEILRNYLLEKYGIGTIAINQTDLRIAFSCVDEDDLEELFEFIYIGIKELLEMS